MILDYIKTLLIICILTISFIYALDFEYGFIGKQTQKSKRFFEINNNDSLLYDYAKLNLKLKDSNFYLILRTNDDDFLMLFNKQSNLGSLTKDDIYVEIPWLDLSKYKNNIKFYIISSDNKLTDIENLISDYSLANKRNKKRFKNKIITFLDGLNNKSITDQKLESRLDGQVMAGVTFRANSNKRIKEDSLFHTITGDSTILVEVVSVFLK